MNYYFSYFLYFIVSIFIGHKFFFKRNKLINSQNNIPPNISFVSYSKINTVSSVINLCMSALYVGPFLLVLYERRGLFWDIWKYVNEVDKGTSSLSLYEEKRFIKIKVFFDVACGKGILYEDLCWNLGSQETGWHPLISTSLPQAGLFTVCHHRLWEQWIPNGLYFIWELHLFHTLTIFMVLPIFFLYIQIKFNKNIVKFKKRIFY